MSPVAAVGRSHLPAQHRLCLLRLHRQAPPGCRAPARPPSLGALLVAAALIVPRGAHADLVATIEAVKPSIVVVGRYNATASPRFTLFGTGFAAGDGRLVVSNQHVIDPPGTEPPTGDLAVLARLPNGELQMRAAAVADRDVEHDLVLLRIEGAPLPALTIGDSAAVREGQALAFIGFPIGGALGYAPVTHRAMVSSITPIALPSPNARSLDAKTLQRLRSGAFNVFQLDATAYPGNSGGPLFDPDSGHVLGVLNMVFVKSTKESLLAQPSGISYAIPAVYIHALMQRQRAR